MNTIVKALTGILGVLAVAACLATIGIIGYTVTGGSGSRQTSAVQDQNDQNDEVLPPAASAVPSTTPEVSDEEAAGSPHPTGEVVDLAGHVHNYVPEVVKEATCYEAGQVKYTCACGDYYYVDLMSTGHVADDWEIVRIPTAQEDGIRVKRCIYCDEIVAQESIPYEAPEGESGTEAVTAHVHEYTATTEREPTCTLAGLRKYTCSCGAFYTEAIPAAGHVASDWTVAEEATSTRMGTEQRVCNVCGVVLDSRPISVLAASPSASASAAATAASSTAATASASASATAGASAAASASATPAATATPHAHSYTSYVLKQANCTEKGIRSFVCSCGSSYAESIDLDLNNHTFRSTVIPATATTQGYTIYTCVRCNYSYVDNYTPALGN